MDNGGMIAISLQSFLTTGVLGPVHLGMTRDQVRQLLGVPDQEGGTSRKYRIPVILRYGDLEFLYRPGEDSLHNIYMKIPHEPSGGHAINLDPWLLTRGLSIEAAEGAFREGGITFKRSTPPNDVTLTLLTTAAGVDVAFVNELSEYADDEEVGLYYLSKCSGL